MSNLDDMRDIINEIALMAIESDAMRGQIQDELEISDSELSEIYNLLILE
jgi:hypothetical protein